MDLINNWQPNSNWPTAELVAHFRQFVINHNLIYY